MQKTAIKKALLLLVCAVLIAAMALGTGGCDDKPEGSSVGTLVYADGAQIGQGEKTFTLTVTDGNGRESTFQIYTDKKTVGEALKELQFIAGDEEAYGLYVKTVNGIRADYDLDGKFWALYVNGQSAPAGVDSIEVEPGATYGFKVE